MMGDEFGLRVGRGEKRLGRAAVQRLPAVFQQAFVGRVLDQRVLEAIDRRRRRTLDIEQVGLGEFFERGAQRRLGQAGDGLQQRVGKLAPQHGADLRDFARLAEPVEAGGERLLQGRRDRLRAALQHQPRHLLDEQRHAAGAVGKALDHLLRQRVALGDRRDHLRICARSSGISERMP